MAQTPAAVSSVTRIIVFVDYWNLQLTLNEHEARNRGVSDYRFLVDWRGLGPWLAKKAWGLLGSSSPYSFEGALIYASYNPKSVEGRGFHKWATTSLDRQPGVNVHCLERKPKNPPRCPSCYRVIEYCPQPDCRKKIVATVEKGVDTLIVTDMIRLAWEGAYDVAVVASSDSDLVPAVTFLGQKGRKVIQAGFPPKGVDLATASWASFDIFKDRADIRRP
jgi:hypothetical protein